MRILVRTIFYIIILLAGVGNLYCQVVSGKMVSAAAELKTNIGISERTLNVEFSLPSISYRVIRVDNESFLRLELKDFTPSGKPGEPELPQYIRQFELDERHSDLIFQIEKLDSTIIDIGNLGKELRIYPVQASVSKSDSTVSEFYLIDTIYKQDRWLGESLLRYAYQGKLRGLPVSNFSFNPVKYNPAENKLVIYHHVKATLTLPEPERISEDLSSPVFDRLHAGILQQRRISTLKAVQVEEPMTMLILSDSMFQEPLQPLIDWKRQKGFNVIEAYTQNPEVGNSFTSIQSYLKGMYENPPEGFAPASFLLLVGDVQHIPVSVPGTYVTDLYYAEYDGGGDYIPDVFYGRISVNADSQLVAVVDKILEYEQFAFPDPSFLNHSVLIAGADNPHGYVEGNGQINYVHENYLNTENGYIPHVFLHPEAASSDSLIRAIVSQGASFVNYTGHGISDGWQDPSFRRSHINTLNNKSKYPLMIGNGCQTNIFTVGECFAETALRAKEKGAIAYIGCTYDSYWDDDFYWSVGVGQLVSDPTYESTSLGYYDKVFHTNGEAHELWAPTLGEMIFAGNMSVQKSGSSRKQMYWEIYQLMGDPSLTPWFKVPENRILQFPSVIPSGSSRLDVKGDPYDYISISRDGKLIHAAHANQQGLFTTYLPDYIAEGYLSLVATGDKRQPVIDSILVGNLEGSYLDLINRSFSEESVASDQIISNGEGFRLDLIFINRGNMSIMSDSLILFTNDSVIDLLDTLFIIDNLAPGDTLLIEGGFGLRALPESDHFSRFMLGIRTSSDILNREIYLVEEIAAPAFTSYGMYIDDRQHGNGDGILDPGELVDIVWQVENSGNYRSDSLQIRDKSPVSGKTFDFFGAGEREPLHQSQRELLRIASRISIGLKDTIYTLGPFELSDGTRQILDSLNINPGRHTEHFSSGDFLRYRYQNNSASPWIIDSSVYLSSAYSARSGMISHYGKSEFSISFSTTEIDSLSFRYKVSSESQFDYFRFYLDSSLIMQKSGITNWDGFTAVIEPGSHTATWSYSKDQSISSGDDAVWVDDIIFPKSVFRSNDLSLIKYISPESGPWLSDNETIEVLLRNIGSDTIRKVFSTTSVNGQHSILHSRDVMLLPGDSATLVLSDTADFSNFSVYEIRSFVTYSGDMFSENDNLIQKVSHYKYPDLALNLISTDSVQGVYHDIVMGIENKGNIPIDTMTFQISINDEAYIIGKEIVNLEPLSSSIAKFRILDSIDFETGSGWYDYLFEAIDPDSLIADNALSGQIFWQAYSVLQSPSGFTLEISPNPVSIGFYMLSSHPFEKDVHFSIYDVNGKIIKQFLMKSGEESRYIPFSQGAGIYFLKSLESPGSIAILKH